jgi:hypothetical protein
MVTKVLKEAATATSRALKRACVHDLRGLYSGDKPGDRSSFVYTTGMSTSIPSSLFIQKGGNVSMDNARFLNGARCDVFLRVS